MGSPHLPAFLAAHKDLLRCDFVLSADGGQVSALNSSTSGQRACCTCDAQSA